MMLRSESFALALKTAFEARIANPRSIRRGFRFELLDVLHCFKQGHLLRSKIQSTGSPSSSQPQSSFDNIYLAKPDDYQKATHRVLRSAIIQSMVRSGPCSGGDRGREVVSG